MRSSCNCNSPLYSLYSKYRFWFAIVIANLMFPIIHRSHTANNANGFRFAMTALYVGRRLGVRHRVICRRRRHRVCNVALVSFVVYGGRYESQSENQLSILLLWLGALFCNTHASTYMHATISYLIRCVCVKTRVQRTHFCSHHHRRHRCQCACALCAMCSNIHTTERTCSMPRCDKNTGKPKKKKTKLTSNNILQTALKI